MPPDGLLPRQSFAEIAVDLKLYAESAQQACQAGEIMLARGGWAAPGMTHTLKELHAAAEMAGKVHGLFMALIPHEEIVRDFFAGLEGLNKDMRRSA